MRVFVYIWTLFILGLGCVPCADGIGVCEKQHTHSKNQDFPQSKDGCTPLCSCMCFGAVVIVETLETQDKAEIKVRFVPSDLEYNLYRKDYIGIIWEPPQSC